jgi:hypothetical protein
MSGARVLLVVAFALAGAQARAGHSRHPYCDGGQSPDGRFVVKTELVTEPAAAKKPAAAHWKFTWTDTKTGTAHTGKLVGLRSGSSAVFDPVHAHVFVPPGGEAFAVWNPNVLAPTDPTGAKLPDLASLAAREWAGFAHRLTVYTKTGEVVARLDLKDFLTDDDWKWLFCYGRQVYWQTNFPGLTRDSAPRVGYALYQISKDHTVLETWVGATDEALHKAKANGVAPPAPRLVRVDLTTGKLLAAGAKLDGDRVPVRPFTGGAIKGGRGNQAHYVPSADPLRAEGKFVEPK